ncbi:hypothetical protein M426DRAFT_242745 [Hypoxylon sp. CI-4A]|nr:hypothetical protein M426DRAFT_242745 [Hypoxylon sp. CI-4A]
MLYRFTSPKVHSVNFHGIFLITIVFKLSSCLLKPPLLMHGLRFGTLLFPEFLNHIAKYPS